VVLLFPNDDLRLAPGWAPELPVRMGQAMANYSRPVG
jgi:hypothetical protein